MQELFLLFTLLCIITEGNFYFLSYHSYDCLALGVTAHTYDVSIDSPGVSYGVSFEERRHTDVVDNTKSAFSNMK